METKDRILAKAKELFMLYGVKSITMDEIAAQLGVSKKTIYQFFSDKDQLVFSVMQEELEDSRENCLRCSSGSENAIHECFLNLDRFVEHVREMNPALLYDLKKFHPEAFHMVSSFKTSFFLDMVRKNLEAGIRQGLYRADIHVEVIARFRVNSVYLIFSPEFTESSGLSLLDLQQELFLHFLHGIATAKGEQLVQKYLKEREKKVLSAPGP